MNDESDPAGSGLSGTLRAIGMLAILALAALAALVVLDVIPREQLAEWGTKIALLAAIAVVAAGGIAALVGGRRK